MTNKYIDVSATYNGDGTASNQAASDGAAGAWNSAINVLKGTPGYGSINAGDVVYVRTYNSGNLSETVSSSVTMSCPGTARQPVTYIFDDGDIWPTGGVFIFTQDNTSQLTWDDNIIFWAEINWDYSTDTYTCGCKFEVVGSHQILPWHKVHDCQFRGIEFKTDDTYTWVDTVRVESYSVANFIECFFNNTTNNGAGSYGLLNSYSYAKYSTYECIFNAAGQTGGTLDGIINIGTYASRGDIYGGKLINTDVNTVLIRGDGSSSRYTYSSGSIKVFDFDIGLGQAFDISEGDYKYIMNCDYDIRFIDNNYFYSDGCGRIEWKNGINYPTLNASLPDNTSWVVKTFPTDTVSIGYPLPVININKLYQDSAANLKIIANFAVKDTSNGSGAYDDLKNTQWYMIVSYVDNTTGLNVSKITDMNGSVISSSSSSWVPEIDNRPIYGPNNYNKYKIELTTDTEVKQNTRVFVSAFCSTPSIYVDDDMFIDPDVSMEAV